MSLVRASLAASLPGYDLGGELGRGAWGVVRDGRRRQDGRAVAIKELPPAFAADRAVRARFLHEAQLLEAVQHPNVAATLDHVARDGVCVLVTEQLTGGSAWADFVVNGVRAPQACAIALAAASGLQALHEHGVLHRGLKPDNLLYGNGTLCLTDAGLARVVGGQHTLATLDGAVLATPAYLAPEQALGQASCAATDVYALGTILYELLAGALPHPDDGNPLVTMRRHVDEPPIPLQVAAPHVPAPVAAAVMQALARHHDERQPSAEAFGVALATAAAGVWGPSWLATSGGPPLLAPGPILAAATAGYGLAERLQETDEAPPPDGAPVVVVPAAAEPADRPGEGWADDPAPVGGLRCGPDGEPLEPSGGGVAVAVDPSGVIDATATEAPVARPPAPGPMEAPPGPMEAPPPGDARTGPDEVAVHEVALDEAPPDEDAVERVAAAAEPPGVDGVVAGGAGPALFDQDATPGVGGGPPHDGPAAPTATAEVVVRPAVIGHPVGGSLPAVAPEDTLPVRTLLVVPPSPRPMLAGAVAAALLALLVVVFGFGGHRHDGGFEVVGADPAALDLDDPVTIEAPGPPGPLALAVSVAGVRVARVERDGTDAGGGRQRAAFDMGHADLLVAGRASLVLYGITAAGDRRVGAIGIDSTQPGWLTAPVIGAAVLALAALAYAEAMFAPARRGRVRLHHLIGLVITAGIAGACFVFVGWAFGAPEPTRVAMVVCAVLTAAAAVLAALARARWARRRQSRRAIRHQQAVREAAARTAAMQRRIAEKEAAT